MEVAAKTKEEANDVGSKARARMRRMREIVWIESMSLRLPYGPHESHDFAQGKSSFKSSGITRVSLEVTQTSSMLHFEIWPHAVQTVQEAYAHSTTITLPTALLRRTYPARK